MLEIFIPVVNRPSFLLKQIILFRKYIVGKYSLHIVIDTNNKKITDDFVNICLQNNIDYLIKPFKKFSDPAKACEHTMQWIVDILYMNYKKSKIMIIDSDMFLINHFDVNKHLNDFTIIGLPQKRKHITYLWNGIIFLNMNKLILYNDKISFEIISDQNIKTDVGGKLFYFLNQYPECLTKKIDIKYPYKINGMDIDINNKNFNFELFFNKSFFHYRAATNWFSLSWKNNREPLEKKLKTFEIIYKKSISKNISDDFICHDNNDHIKIEKTPIKKLMINIYRKISIPFNL